MFDFLISLLQSVLKFIFSKRKDLILTMMNLKKVQSNIKKNDRLFLSLIFRLSKRATNHLMLVKPSTLLDWQRRFIKNFWTYKHKPPGRKPVSREIKDLILQMKQENTFWGCHRVADELKKIGIEIHPNTVNKIFQTFRKQGKIHSIGSWSKFLKSHWNSLFGRDFMTIDTLFGKRLYLFIILELKSRRIIRAYLADNPCREFVKQRIELFSEEFQDQKITLIHDNAPQFTSIDYSWYNIEAVNICSYAPNMNAYVERLNSSIRRQALDHFLLFSEKQIRKIIKEYVNYYNHLCPHQGTKRIPKSQQQFGFGKI